MIQAEIEALSNGCLFRRADLHIHSYGEFGSYDVTDTTMTPEAIVDLAIAEGLSVIAITDHNVIGNVRRALTHAEHKELLVVPGIELSTQQGHCLVYFASLEQLERFYGKLTISADKKSCSETIPQILRHADQFGGFGVLAHIESEAGLEKSHPKFDAFKQEILNCRNLLAIEILHVDTGTWFGHADDDKARRNCAKLRCEALGQEDEIELAKVMSSDAHAITALGRNANGKKRLTRFKMESLTFDSLRTALLDCAARVRLEDLIPPSIPHFIGMKLEGGFLKDQVVHFSRNLTCIIGGRGAGKSTMLESLRVASGNGGEGGVVDSEVWPDEISLIFEDEAGQRHTLSRSKLNEVVNADEEGPTRIAIESYGQGETAETIQHCDKDPKILLQFLDGFIELEALHQEDDRIRDELLENQDLIETLQREKNQIAETEKAKSIADRQVAALKGQNAVEVVKKEEQLAKERRFREQLKTNLHELLLSINDGLTSEDLKNLTADFDGSTLAVGKTEFDSVKNLVDALAADVDRISTDLKQTITDASARISTQLKSWVTKERATQQEIEDLRRTLEQQGIKLDMGFIRKVTGNATFAAAKLVELKKSVPKLAEAHKSRRALMASRRETRSRIFTTRTAFATLMNKNLATTTVDYQVHIRFHEGLLSDEYEELLKSTMGWRTAQVPKASLIAAQVHPFALLDAIDDKDISLLLQVKDADNNQVLTRGEAQAILREMSEWTPYTSLQRIQFQDRPEIKVTKTVDRPDGSKTYPTRDFSQLSLGQQQAILLSILLFSKSRTPLIIDQPEDNLDSEFIYKTLVRSLRNIKEQRQVIVVTHNANIAVLGDAELIIPLRGSSEVSVIRNRGSIDTDTTKDIVCTILEGSKKAFKRRQELYGIA
jgi:ABC-type lipoprotein export system ATPase subunit